MARPIQPAAHQPATQRPAPGHPAPRHARRGLLTRIVSSLLGAACAGACIVALATWWAASLALLITSPARAQAAPAPQHQPAPALADPTRPPGGAAGTPGSTNGSPGSATGNGQRNAATPGGTARASAASATTAPALAPLLQGLHLPRPGRPSALIDGQVLQVGDRVQDWTVQSIHTDGVWLTRTAARGPITRPPTAPTQAAAAVVAAGHPPHTLWLSLLPPLAAASAVPRP